MQQSTEAKRQTKTESSELVRFVKKLTGCTDLKQFRGIDVIAKAADDDPNVRSALSVAYQAGQTGRKLEDGVWKYLSEKVSNGRLKPVVEAVYSQGRTKSGRLKNPYFP